MKKDNQQFIIYAAGGVALFFLIKPIYNAMQSFFQGAGITKSPAQQRLNEMQGNPKSFWNAEFWKLLARQIGKPVSAMTVSNMQKLWNELNVAFGYFNDDESAAIASFKKYIRYQTQLSFFSDWVQKNQNTDLLGWLQGNTYPNDRLSPDEIDIITQYVQNLPKTK